MPDQSTSPPPAYFLSLSLENVRSFGAKQTIYFTKDGKVALEATEDFKGNAEEVKPAQWTIILGDNGVGKTTILRALAALRPSRKAEPEIARQTSKLPSFLPSFFEGKVSTWAITRLIQDREFILSRMRYLACAGLPLSKLNDGHTNTSSFIGFVAVTQERSGLEYVAHTVTEPAELGLMCYGYGAGRTTGNSTLTDSPETADTCASLFDDRADLLNPEEWFLNIDYGIRLLAEDKRKQLSDANDRVRQMLKDVLPGVTDLRIENSGTPQKPQISLQFLLYGTWVRLRDMSLGYQTLIVWLTDLASKLFVRYPESDNPLAEPAIVLIDEIDLHLHPQWQRELLGMLSKIFVNTQFIATAHSPLVALAAGDEGANMVLLRREGDQTIVSQNPVDVRGWRVDQILTSTFFNLETARSLETEKKLDRQATLLNKEKLTAKQRQELDDLTLELEGQPMGSVGAEEEEEAMLRELTRRAGKRPKA